MILDDNNDHQFKGTDVLNIIDYKRLKNETSDNLGKNDIKMYSKLNVGYVFKLASRHKIY